MPSDSSDSSDAPRSENVDAAPLKLVGDSAQDAAGRPTDSAAPQSEGSSESSGRGGVPLWLVLMGLLAFVVIVSWQARQSGLLQNEVTRLETARVEMEAELSRSSALLDAHRLHLADVRGGVDDLSRRIAGLRGLVEADPEASVSEDTGRSTPTEDGSPDGPADR